METNGRKSICVADMAAGASPRARIAGPPYCANRGLVTATAIIVRIIFKRRSLKLRKGCWLANLNKSLTLRFPACQVCRCLLPLPDGVWCDTSLLPKDGRRHKYHGCRAPGGGHENGERTHRGSQPFQWKSAGNPGVGDGEQIGAGLRAGGPPVPWRGQTETGDRRRQQGPRHRETRQFVREEMNPHAVARTEQRRIPRDDLVHAGESTHLAAELARELRRVIEGPCGIVQDDAIAAEERA